MIALALNHNADVLVVMEMIAVKPYKTRGLFFKVGSKVHFRIYEAVTGKQIAETIVVHNVIVNMIPHFPSPSIDMRLV